LKGLAFALKRRARASARLAFAPTRARRRGRGDRRAIEKSFQSLVGIRPRYRRLSKDYEELPEVAETMVTLAAIRLMLHRLAHPNRKRLPPP
ncbi:MAG TPA: hypothetical protein VEB64_04270, partial [Azospirillaceae bacterium]|nr:hypothetical protein [Azospirillaceae bacterium]